MFAGLRMGLSGRVGLRMSVPSRLGLRPQVSGLIKALPLQPLHRTSVSRAAKKVTDKVEGNAASRRFPKFMAKYASKIGGAPVSYVTAFLLVHELTAIVPLFGLWGTFYYFDYMPTGLPDWVVEKGRDFILKIAERNDWTYVMNAEKGSRIVIQGAAAYAIVKAILPLRLIFSLWCMPWTAKHLVIPITSRVSRLFRSSKKQVKKGELPETLKKKAIVEDPTKPKL